MLKTIYVLCLVLFLMSCSSQEKSNEAEEMQDSTTVENSEQAKEEPVAAVEYFIGSWTVDAATAGIQMDLTLRADGSLSQKMGEQEQIGSWVQIDKNHLRITSTGAPKGQTWEIVKSTTDELDICWNPDSDQPKTIPFKRVTE
jgi:hypothetical protein